MKETTVGQRIVAALIGHQLGIPADQALGLYVHGRELDPSWEKIGASLLLSLVSAPVHGGAYVAFAADESCRTSEGKPS
jgi:hypothetical protein